MRVGDVHSRAKNAENCDAALNGCWVAFERCLNPVFVMRGSFLGTSVEMKLRLECICGAFLKGCTFERAT